MEIFGRTLLVDRTDDFWEYQSGRSICIHFLSFCSSSPALYLKGERREECAAVDDTPLTDARSAKEEEMEETANYLSG
jgi:hypothetical protein